MKKPILVLILAGCMMVTAAFAAPPTLVWNVTYESGGWDQPLDVATDAAGNVYVTGFYGDIGSAACRTIKYDTDGNMVWNKLYDEDGIDLGWGIDVDASGNVYVAGWAYNGADWDYLVIKYDSDGEVIWDETWDGIGNDIAAGVAVDALGNVYVTGGSVVGGASFRTIKYDSGGNLQWSHPYDEFGNGSVASEVAVDAAGNVYVTGQTQNGANADFLTIKYDKDGNLEWSDVRDENYEDVAWGVAVDADANVYVTGSSGNSSGNLDFFTVKYNTEGVFQWKKRYGGDDGEQANAIAVDRFFVYVTGTRNNGVDNDFLTVRYDKEGTFSWEKDYDSGDGDGAQGIAVDALHYLYVAGNYFDAGGDYDFRVIKYEQDDIPAVAETPTTSPITLEVIDNFCVTPRLNYALPAGSQGTLAFYSADGRLIQKSSINSSQSAFTWDASEVPSGVYFAKLTVGNESITVKTILTK